MTIAGSITRAVLPSGAERATFSVPIIPPAPGRLSATTVTPSGSASPFPSTRPSVSTTPPGA